MRSYYPIIIGASLGLFYLILLAIGAWRISVIKQRMTQR